MVELAQQGKQEKQLRQTLWKKRLPNHTEINLNRGVKHAEGWDARFKLHIHMSYTVLAIINLALASRRLLSGEVEN